MLVLQQAMRRRRYRRMDVTGKFRMEIAVSLRALGFLGLRRQETETLQEFRERVLAGEMLRTTREAGRPAAEDRERGEGLCALQCIIDYEKSLYGEKAAGWEMLQTAVRERKELLAVLRERKRWRYMLFWW